MFDQITAVAGRVLRQLAHDRRFVVLSLIAPVVIIYLLYVFFDSVDRPFFNQQEFVPPVGAYMVHFLTYILTAIVLVRERTSQTMTRMFVSGYSRPSIIGGYILAYSVLATLQSLFVLTELNFLFEMGYSTNRFLAMYMIIWLLAIASIAMGIFISNFARNEGQVLPTVPLVLLPAVFFSGMIMPIENLPRWMGYLAFTTPMYYATDAIDNLATGVEWSMVASLIIYGLMMMVLAVLTLREQA